MSSNTFPLATIQYVYLFILLKEETNCTSLLNLLRKSGNYTFKELIYCKYYMRLVSKLLGLGYCLKFIRRVDK